MDSSAAERTTRRGRPPAASREQVLDAATDRYLRGRRVDVQAIAAELGLGRTTIYRWFGSREELIGEASESSGSVTRTGAVIEEEVEAALLGVKA
jgi:AcrR family transcriptional regulator